MKSIVKRCMAFMMALLLAGGIVLDSSGSVFAATNDTLGDYKYRIIDGTYIEITGYHGSVQSVNIPSELTVEGVSYPVKSIGGNAFYGCSSLTSINIPASVMSIGRWALYGCSNLTSIIIPASVTSIGDYAFYGCSSLASVFIPDSVTSIGDCVFKDCDSLSDIEVDANNTKYDSRNSCNAIIKTSSNCLLVGCKNTIILDSVTSIGYGAFEGCSSLTSITIPASVTSIGNYAFYGCSSLTSIAIPDSVTRIADHAFKCCSGLTSITIPANVTSIEDEAFYGCSSLTSIIIPASVTSIGDHAFEGCSNLTSITIPGSVTSIEDHAFYGCSSLRSISIPGSVTSIGGYAFSCCSRLTSITIPDSVTSIGDGIFEDCDSLGNIEVDVNNTKYDSRDNCNAIIEKSSDCLLAGCKNTIIPASVTSIGAAAFMRHSGLTSIAIPDSVTSIGNLAFSYCSSLTSITIPGSVTSIGGAAFSYCSSLTIYGSKNSYAKTYAKEHNIPFEIYTGEIGGNDPGNENTFVGILEEANPTKRTLTISGKKYNVSDGFSMVDASNIIIDGGDQYVICTTVNGIINKLVNVSDVLEPEISISTIGDDITYQNRDFVTDSQTIRVHVSCKVKGNYISSIFWNSGIRMHIDAFKLTTQDVAINFGKKGIVNKKDIKEIEQKVNKDVFIDNVATYDFIINVSDDYEPSLVAKQKFKLKAVVTAGSQTAESEWEISVINLDYQRQKAEQKKEALAAKHGLSDAQKELQRLCKNYSMAKGIAIREYLDSQQIEAFDAYVYTWLAEVNNANTYTDDNKINKKINEKLGIDEKIIPILRTAKATTYFEAETKKYGKRRFEITLDIMTMQNSGKALGSFGTLKYKLVDKKGIPGNISTEEVLPVTYANMNNFCDYLKGVAESAVKNAYKESWGKHADKVADMLIDKTIMDVIKNQWGSFSNGVYTLLTKPTEDYVKKVKVKCPVDVFIYDMEGNICGSIVNNVVDDSYTDIAMTVEGDEKTFYLTGNDYSVKLVGNDTGMMTYIVEELDDNMQNLRTIEFDNLPLKKGTTYKGFVMEPVYIDNALYSLEKDENDVVYPDVDTYQDVLTKNLVERISLSVTEQSLKKGGVLQLEAAVYPTNAENKSIRWESDNAEVAIVNDTGLVKGVGIGEAVITAKSRDGSNIIAACKIKVTDISGSDSSGSGSGSSGGGGASGGGSSSDGGGTSGGSSSGSGSSNGNGNLVVELSHYIVYFDANGGSNLSRKTMTLLNDDNLGILPKTTRKNYTFKGWYTQKTGGKKVSKSTVLNAATTLYAHWSKVAKPSKVKAPVLKVSKTGQISVSLKKVTGAKGYEIAYSMNKSFKASSTTRVRTTSLKKILKKLKAGKKYYVKVRAYKIDSTGKRIYGAYSVIKSIRVKQD